MVLLSDYVDLLVGAAGCGILNAIGLVIDFSYHSNFLGLHLINYDFEFAGFAWFLGFVLLHVYSAHTSAAANAN